MEITLTLAQITNRAAIYHVEGEPTWDEDVPTFNEVYLAKSVFPSDQFTIQFPKTIKVTAESGPGTEWVTMPRLSDPGKSTLWIQKEDTK